MRIVAGRHKGRTLSVPRGRDTRPTSDRVREAIFNVLTHGFDLDFDDASVLDVCAGTGAFGLEALSRGAARAIFVDTEQIALDTVAANVESLGEKNRATILRRDVRRFGARAASADPASLAFFDPPYRQNLCVPALSGAAAGDWLAPEAIVVVETAEDEVFDVPPGFVPLDERRYGKTLVRYFRYTA